MLAAMYAEKYGDVAAAVNLDGHSLGRSGSLGMDPTAAAQLRMKLRVIGDRSICELSLPRTAAEVAIGREAWLHGAKALGLDSALARDAFERRVVEDGEGTFRFRPTAESLTQMRNAIEELDLLGLYGQAEAPQLVCVAGREQPDPNLPEDVRALAVEYRRGLILRLQEIAESRPTVQVREIDATHGLIYECPELIADQIRDHRDELAAPIVSVGAANLGRE
jgi:pimeloyl-ACP methyl ester carboxylesterase